ncbi:MAG: hypothetical protein ACK4GR_00875 [bacterium]
MEKIENLSYGDSKRISLSRGISSEKDSKVSKEFREVRDKVEFAKVNSEERESQLYKSLKDKSRKDELGLVVPFMGLFGGFGLIVGGLAGAIAGAGIGAVLGLILFTKD